MDLRIYSLREDDFDKVIELGNTVHGKNYLDTAGLVGVLNRSLSQGLCCSYVMYDKSRKEGKLIGFRLTYAPGLWTPDEWCSVDSWGVDPDKICYFKSNTIHEDYRGQGIGPVLLNTSIETVKKMGAVAGVTHIWLESPSNSAYKYFSKTGAELLWVWPGRWKDDLEKDGYRCVVCCADDQARPCSCTAAEMILHFGE